MHVLVTADTIGGVWTYTRELVTGLAQRGVRVTLISFGEIPSSAQLAWMEGLRGVDLRPTGFRLEWMQDSAEDLSCSAEYLQQIIRETAPDLLHLNQYYYGSLGTNVPKIVVAHSDVISWWVAVHGREPENNDWIKSYREIVSRGLAGADVVVAPTRWMLQQVAGYYLEPARAQVIHNGRNPLLFNPYVSKEDLVLSVGRIWDAGKNATLLAERDHNIPVLIAGSDQHPDEEFRGRLQRAAGLGVRFCGPQSEEQLRLLYSRASMYAATSRYEPFGLAAVEAALSRCAIVANDIPSLREVWEDAACYFRQNDADDLARTIARLQSDREQRLTYANLAYRRVRERFTAARMVNDYLDLYRSLVSAEVAAA